MSLNACPDRHRHPALARGKTSKPLRAACKRGIRMSGIRHRSPVDTWKGDWRPGPDPQCRDYARPARFADPDGTTWVIQEIGHRATLAGSAG